MLISAHHFIHVDCIRNFCFYWCLHLQNQIVLCLCCCLALNLLVYCVDAARIQWWHDFCPLHSLHYCIQDTAWCCVQPHHLMYFVWGSPLFPTFLLNLVPFGSLMLPFSLLWFTLAFKCLIASWANFWVPGQTRCNNLMLILRQRICHLEPINCFVVCLHCLKI